MQFSQCEYCNYIFKSQHTSDIFKQIPASHLKFVQFNSFAHFELTRVACEFNYRQLTNWPCSCASAYYIKVSFLKDIVCFALFIFYLSGCTQF